MSNAIELPPALEAYLYEVATDEPEVLRRLREETALDPRAGMQISPDAGQFLRFLVHAFGVRRALEVGVFTGYSSTCVALALPDDGRLIACDVSEAWTSVARRYWELAGVAHKIELRLAPALETLDALLAQGHAGTFDFAFIDADKSNYTGYYERAVQLVRSGGIIAADNVLWGGDVARPEVQDDSTVAIRNFNRHVKSDERVFRCLLTLRDGITLAWKR